MIQETSKIAYESVENELGERQRKVYVFLKGVIKASNMQISKCLNLPINQITPRVLELRQKGLVKMDKIDLCPQTGRRVIYWKVVTEKPIDLNRYGVCVQYG